MDNFKKILRKPKYERRDALKFFNYDAQSSFSSFESSSSVYTCSTDLNDSTSFRIDGIEGDFDRICRTLGLSGREDFSTSNVDDFSSTAAEPSVSPNGRIRIKPLITPGCWQKGELVGRGSFGSVYEGISE
jgi:hypothetical protein